MSFTKPAQVLTQDGTMAMLQAAMKKAAEIGQPQCIVIVDQSGAELGKIRMDGAKFLSLKSALAKARTAASIRGATTNISDTFGPPIAAATGGDMTALPGGLPIAFDGEVVGAVGIGSGTGEQDVAVARAALAAVGADEV